MAELGISGAHNEGTAGSKGSCRQALIKMFLGGRGGDIASEQGTIEMPYSKSALYPGNLQLKKAPG